MQAHKLLSIFISCLMLNACGGGSEDGESSPTATTSSATLEWDIPTTRENGDALDLSEIAGYSIQYKKSSDETYTTLYIEDNSNIGSYSLENIESGSYELRIAAVDTDGLYGEFSSPITGDL